MDFQQLLRQAKAKQSVVEKKHVQQKTKKEEEKRQKETLESQRQRETNEKLKQAKEEAIRRQLEYKGLHKPSKALAPPLSDHVTSHSRKSTSPSCTSGKPAGKSKSGADGASSVSKSKTSETGKTKDVKGQSSSLSKSKSSVSKPPVKPKPPSNFNDLMKMAKMNKGGDKPPDKMDYPPRRSSSPLGKSLLEKSGSRTANSKQTLNISKSTPGISKPPPGNSKSPSSGIPKSSPGNSSSSLSRTTSNKQPPTQTAPQGPPGGGGGARHHTPPGSKGTPSTKLNGHAPSIQNGRLQPSPSKLTRDSLPSLRPPARPSGGRTNPDLAARKATLQRTKAKSVQPTAFYGSAAANILRRKDGGSSGGPLRYTSSWVDEIREEMEDLGDYDYLSEDEEGDLDDFVVDEGDDFIDDGDTEDYSHHIRKIFGYDKRRFADEQFDDRLMESSFAQQQFEEERSAQIGKLEDDEEQQKEQAKLARKRKRNPSPVRTYGVPKSHQKQPKLSFR